MKSSAAVLFQAFTVLALAPGDPLGELTTNPNVPAEVRLALRATSDPQQFPSSVDPRQHHLFNAAGWNDSSVPVKLTLRSGWG